MSSSDDSYLLDRTNATETARLNAQHEGYITALGYHIHPAILAAHPPTAALKVAEVGTGTAIFLQDLAAAHPSWTLHGFDISDAAYPPPVARPTSLALHLHDAKTPFPAEWHGVFDVVHMRLLTVAMGAREDWTRVARHAAQLLRPGGALQWCESNYNPTFLRTAAARAEDAGVTLRMQEVFDGLYHVLGPAMAGVYEPFTGEAVVVKGALRAAGLQRVWDDVVSSDRDIETRGKFARVNTAVGVNLLKKMRGEDALSAQDLERIEQETASGLYTRFDVHMCIGWKP
ncbi:hypothetical protein FH972_022758 [Carpinus fangiana]|uniref:Methyltransferase type 12 domain-containing protein n=1 Tax=Carpinus fangiana TaxID=176857 RepID=A0A5N6KT57_9ROSI|nr:hypothetical protein FH972_022758 [Carpinus fangiana]